MSATTGHAINKSLSLTLWFVVYVYSPCNQIHVQGQPGLHRYTFCQNDKKLYYRVAFLFCINRSLLYRSMPCCLQKHSYMWSKGWWATPCHLFAGKLWIFWITSCSRTHSGRRKWWVRILFQTHIPPSAYYRALFLDTPFKMEGYCSLGWHIMCVYVREMCVVHSHAVGVLRWTPA